MFKLLMTVALLFVGANLYAAEGDSDTETPTPPPEPPFEAGITVFGPIHINRFNEGSGDNIAKKEQLFCHPGTAQWIRLLPHNIATVSQYKRANLTQDVNKPHLQYCEAAANELSIGCNSSSLVHVRYFHENHAHHTTRGYVYLYREGEGNCGTKFARFLQKLGQHY